VLSAANCGDCRRIAVTFASPRQRHTKAFEKYVANLFQHMTPQDIAHYVGTVNAIDQRRLQALPQASLRRVKRIDPSTDVAVNRTRNLAEAPLLLPIQLPPSNCIGEEANVLLKLNLRKILNCKQAANW
jgi:hypothetical protein